MKIGIKSNYPDGTPTIQVWDARSGKVVGEYESNSPDIPECYIICDTIGLFNHYMELAHNNTI
jgi:hypothetical protein